MLLPGSGGALADGEISLSASESEIVDMLNGLLRCNDSSKQYILTALMKLSAKFSSETDKIKQIVKNYAEHTMLEVQQRSCEYLKIFDYDEVCCISCKCHKSTMKCIGSMSVISTVWATHGIKLLHQDCVWVEFGLCDHEEW